MAANTREQLLNKAEALFAEKGFYGASIAAIADELCLTKQALLHHFGSKEKLYAEVLHRISARFDELNIELSDISDPAQRFKTHMLQLHDNVQANSHQTGLLIRELLDNKRRADTAGRWYLRPFLLRLVAMVREIPGWRDASDARVLAMIYQLLGSINYYAISGPTLANIFGADDFGKLDREFPRQLGMQIDAVLQAR